MGGEGRWALDLLIKWGGIPCSPVPGESWDQSTHAEVGSEFKV